MTWAKDRVALVTGASRGIGCAVAVELAELGATVVLASRTNPPQSLLKRKNIFFQKTDLSKSVDISKLFSQLKKKFGTLDIVVNNAGTFTKTPFVKVTESEFDRTIAINTKAPFLISQAAFGLMKAGGSIVNISSLAGIRSAQKFTGYVPYIVSKFGVVGLTEALAEEGRAKGIRVNCVAPGAVETDMLKLWDPHIKTNASAKDLAQVVVRVAELGMTILTGATIEVPTSVWRDH